MGIFRKPTRSAVYLFPEVVNNKCLHVLVIQILITSWMHQNDGRDSNDYIYGDSSPVIPRTDGIINLAYDYETLDSQYFVNPIIDRLNAGGYKHH